jgi:hypothetical protein
VCGDDWATDTYTRTYTVTPHTNGSFDVTELYRGTFTTLAGNTPDYTTGTTCGALAAGITGTFYGSYAITVSASADFNFTATCQSGCTTNQFFSTFFAKSATWFSDGGARDYAWQFYYNSTTPSNGSWKNTDHGNSGNITTATS